MSEALSSQELAALEQTPMFSALDDEAIGKLLTSCRIIRRPAGTMICSPSQQADKFFVVLAGQAKIFMLSPKGEEQTLHLYGPGNSFGEAAMWSEAKFPAFAESLSELTLLVVSEKALRQVLTDSSDLAMGMLAGLSAKLREFSRLIEQLSLKEVPARLASVLLAEAERSGSNHITLAQSKRQLAAQIGTVAETLSRTLAKLKDLGLIDVNGSTIRIVDTQGMTDLARGG